MKLVLVIIVRLIAGVIALYLLKNCCHGENLMIKMLYGVVAFMFPEVYIIYYAIYRILMGNKCPVA